MKNLFHGLFFLECLFNHKIYQRKYLPIFILESLQKAGHLNQITFFSYAKFFTIKINIFIQ